MAFGNSIKLSNISENWLFQFGFYNGDAQGNGDGGFSAVTQADGTLNLLTANVNNSATTFAVDDGSVFTAGDYIQVESEVVKVTNISSNNLTVVRVQKGTSAEAHENNDSILWANYLPIAFTDTLYNDVFYFGAVINNPSIRESINLANSTAKTSNINIIIPDFNYQGTNISQELHGGTRKYINQEVKVFSQINNDTPNQIGSFRLTDISTDGKKISLSLTSHKPFDFISFPQDRTTATNKIIPVVYGQYTPNESNFNADGTFCDTKLYPVESLGVDDEKIRTLMPRAYSSGSDAHINIWHGANVFLPLETAAGGQEDATTLLENANCIETSTNKLAYGIVFAQESRNPTGTGTEFNNTHLAFDNDTETASTISVTDTGNYLLGFTTIPEKWSTHSVKIIRLKHKYSLDASFNVYIYNGTNNNVSGAINFTADTFQTTVITISGTVKVGEKWTILYIRTSGSNGTLSVGSVKAHIHTAFDTSDASELKRLGEVKYWYSGGNGLKETYSGSSNVITEIHEAHRDLLIRYAGIGIATPTGWSDLDSSKNWKIRYWTHKVVDLEKILNKFQYEGGFIFRFAPDGSPQYIHIKDSYGSVDFTLTKQDLSDIKINLMSFSNLLTQMNIQYEKHPAENRYTNNSLSSNDTARKNNNIKTLENISEVNLDAYVSPSIPTIPGTNPNDDFYTYYDNIFGSIKIIVQGTIVNPFFYDLEVGNIVGFDDMHPTTPLGHNSSSWTNLKFMIISITRSKGSLKFKAREI